MRLRKLHQWMPSRRHLERFTDQITLKISSASRQILIDADFYCPSRFANLESGRGGRPPLPDCRRLYRRVFILRPDLISHPLPAHYALLRVTLTCVHFPAPTHIIIKSREYRHILRDDPMFSVSPRRVRYATIPTSSNLSARYSYSAA